MKTINELELTKMMQEKTIKGKLKLYGYSYGDKPMQIDKNLLETARVLTVMPETNIIKTSIQEINAEAQIKNIAKEFFDNFFNLHPVKTIDEESFSKICLPYVNEETSPKKLFEMCEQLDSNSKEVFPYDLPITYVQSSLPMAGLTRKPMIIKFNEKYLKKQNIYFSGIQLGDIITKITPYIYIHEIVHTQVESIKGSVRDYHNSEFLPIFVELIAAYEMDSSKEVLNYIINVRLRHTLENLALLYQGKGTLQDKLSHTLYTKSTLQALQLFNIYTNSSKTKQQDMINGIQRIFDGELVLEAFLSKYGVNFTKSSDPTLVKKHINNYKK